MKERNVSVLIIDGGPRHTVDIVRSLGCRGIDVTVLAAEPYAPARFSRYLSNYIQYDLDATSHDDAIRFLVQQAQTRAYDVFIASGLTGFRFLAAARSALAPYVQVPIVDASTFALAEDKADITRYAEAAGVPVPSTYYPQGQMDLASYVDIPYPVIVKARRGQGHFAYAGSYEQLKNETYPYICARVPEQIEAEIFPILQNLVHGKGHGFYALMNQGRLRAYFMHERLHEVPPSGGPSAMACSYIDPALVAAGSQLLEKLDWHGVAMVEFKKDRDDGLYKLIEINPKFWGSLGLSIRAGVDFPYALVKMALAGDVEMIHPPQTSLTYQWLSMDMAYSVAMGNPLLWMGSVLRGVPNDFRLDDPLPSLALIGRGGVDVALGRRTVRKPGYNPQTL